MNKLLYVIKTQSLYKMQARLIPYLYSDSNFQIIEIRQKTTIFLLSRNFDWNHWLTFFVDKSVKHIKTFTRKYISYSLIIYIVYVWIFRFSVKRTCLIEYFVASIRYINVTSVYNCGVIASKWKENWMVA